MISFSIAPRKLLALCLLLILSTADDFNLTDPPLGQQAAVGFSPTITDDAIGSIVIRPAIQNEVALPPLSDGLMENTKSSHKTDGENVNCAAGSPHAHKRLSRSSRRIRKRHKNDFCSLQDHEKLKLAPPLPKPGASDIPAGQQGKAGVERTQGSMGESDEFFLDPMLDLKESQLYGKPNSELCPNLDMRVPVCTPYDQKITSPAPFLAPSRFCMCFFFLLLYPSPFKLIMIYLGPCPTKSFPLADS